MRGMRGTDPVYIMLVADVSEVPQVSFGKEHGHTQGMYGCISESLIKKAAPVVQPIEVFLNCIASEEVEVPYFEI